MRAIFPSFLIWQESGRRKDPSAVLWPEMTSCQPDLVAHRGTDSPKLVETSLLLLPRQSRLFTALGLPLGVGTPLSLQEQRLAHKTVHFHPTLAHFATNFSGPTRTLPTWPDRGPPTATSTPRSPRNHPKSGRTKTERQHTKFTTKRCIGPRLG